MNNTLLPLIGTALISTGLMFAQTPAPSDQTTPPAARPHRQMMRAQGRLGAFAAELNLTADQKQQAQAIFQQARQSAQPLRAQLKQARLDLQAAEQSNAPATQIETLATNLGNLTGQLATQRAKSFAQFYALLTPDQRALVDANRQRFTNGVGMRNWNPNRNPKPVQQ